MKTFEPFLVKIDEPTQRERMTAILQWVQMTFPHLEPVIKWNQPMFLDHGTYIIGFSIAANHIAFAPESGMIERFTEEIKLADYEYGKKIVRIAWDKPIAFELLQQIITQTIEDKKECESFWL